MFQGGSADTLNFMLLGMGAILGVMLLYAANLILRWRSSKHELELLQELENGDGEAGDGGDRAEGAG